MPRGGALHDRHVIRAHLVLAGVDIDNEELARVFRLHLGPDPLQTLIDGNRTRGVEPDWRSDMPECRHDRDVPWELEAAAREALERDTAAETVGAGAA